ncbi:MAG: dihydroorotate dehydrogenase electron transfer subunit [Bacteroidales bacterium]|nr:dihydroorotate dehydrogenase electron transfer subunit [Bacteroidales bacterium]
MKVIQNKKVNKDYYVLEVESSTSTSDILAGQFVEILVKDTRNAFLRRPISIYNVNPKKNSFELLIQIVGEGTQLLSELKVGDNVDIMFPLGKSYTLASEGQKVLLVGGGVGVAPLLYLSKKLKEKGVDSHILLGGRGIDNIIEVENFKKYSTVHISTDDGSIGEKGFVTQHSVMQNMDFDMIYSCGPDPMMRAVAKIAKEQTINCEVSLENMMACGIGACLCCVTETTSGHQCVCTDGPVFNTKVLDWK